MLTLESKFADYMKLMTAIEGVMKPCEDATKPQSELLAKNLTLTIGEVFAGYRDDPNFNDEWGAWCLNTVGKELDDKIRLMIVNKVYKPETAKYLLVECPHLTEAEIGILKAKIDGKMPTVEKEILDGKVILAADRVR